MADLDQQLVKTIADAVLEALRSGDRVPGVQVASVQPPAGVCTGDYSKFTELRERGREVGAESPGEMSGGSAKPQAAITGIVTAEQLRDAMKAAADGVAVLAADARLTPLAADLAREMPEKVRRLTNDADPRRPLDVPFLWWADGHCPTSIKIANNLRDRLRPTVAPRSAQGLLQVVRDLAKRVKASEALGGVLFVQSGALAMCYANRCRSLRAVLGTCEAAVEQGVRELGVNVLVIEYPYVKPDAMAAMVRKFTVAAPKVPQHAQRELSELEECG